MASDADRSVRAADKLLTLSQAVLAPLDAVFEAQVHAARSFLNMVLQLGYPPSGGAEAEGAATLDQQKAFLIEFLHEADLDGERILQRTRVPALSLVPVSPLAVKSAEFTMEMAVKGVAQRRQHQRSREPDGDWAQSQEEPRPRPWFLVEEPVTLCGVIAPPEEKGVVRTRSGEATVKINIKVEAIPTPAGLDRLLSSIGHMTQHERVEARPVQPR